MPNAEKSPNTPETEAVPRKTEVAANVASAAADVIMAADGVASNNPAKATLGIMQLIYHGAATFESLTHSNNFTVWIAAGENLVKTNPFSLAGASIPIVGLVWGLGWPLVVISGVVPVAGHAIDHYGFYQCLANEITGEINLSEVYNTCSEGGH